MSFNIESFHSLIKGLTSTSHSMHSSELYDCIKPDLDLLRTQSMSTKIWFHTALALFLKIVVCTKGVQQRTCIVHPSFDLLLPEVCTKHPISIHIPIQTVHANLGNSVNISFVFKSVPEMYKSACCDAHIMLQPCYVKLIVKYIQGGSERVEKVRYTCTGEVT